MQNNEQALLEPKLVTDIKGEFFVPAYQRGYRWEKEHVTRLLDDVWENGDNNYSLQPIVVKRLEDGIFELIDGQQRCTTLYLILNYMKQVLPFIEVNFTLSYETREGSVAFLANPNKEQSEDYIDYFYIYNAFIAIGEWFNDPSTGDKNLKAINLYKYFGERVKVIWYEVNSYVDSTALFTRLNIGKIPLTNAELVKALFLSKDGNEITEEKQLEISTSWDLIEKDLQDDQFWYFLTNQSPQQFATRIELIFNLMANKADHEREEFYTFFYFSKETESKSKVEIWNEIEAYFLILKEWFEKRDIYHKVGYLVAIGNSMRSIIDGSKELTKTQFQQGLDQAIQKSLNLSKEDLLGLSYDHNKDKRKIERVLLLHNVETVRRLQDSTVRYSFSKHKKNRWSLEHIHAQQSEGLNKQVDQQEWLRLHRQSLEQLATTTQDPERVLALVNRIDETIENVTKEKFDMLFNDVFELLSESDDRSYIDSISNMALLSTSNNSALSNATFDVKRNKVLEMDKYGEYIPICTRRVFLKYYTESQDHQLQFWSEQDRKAYVNNMVGEDGMLVNYLRKDSVNV